MWPRSDIPDSFDITMGSHNPTQVTNHVGIYFLHSLSNSFPKLLSGLYRKNSLFIIPKVEIERTRKEI